MLATLVSTPKFGLSKSDHSSLSDLIGLAIAALKD